MGLEGDMKSKWVLLATLLAIYFCDGLTASRLPAQDSAAAEAQLPDVRKQQQERKLLADGRMMIDRLLRANDDVLFLEGTLATLHAMTTSPKLNSESNLIERLDEFNSRSWTIPSGVPFAEAFAQAEQSALEANSPISLLRETGREYKELTGQPWVYDWQTRREHWLAVVGNLITARRRNVDAEFWRNLIAAEEKDADLYRFVYLAAVQSSPQSVFDNTIASGLIHDGLNAESRIRRLGFTWLASRSGGSDSLQAAAERQQIWDHFLNAIRTSGFRPTARIGVTKLLAQIHHACASQREADALTTLLVEFLPARTFHRFAQAVGFSQGEIQDWFFGKSVTVLGDNRKVGDLVTELLAEVALPIILDEEVSRCEEVIVVGRHRGPWHEVLEQSLKNTQFRLAYLPGNYLWLGREARKSEMAERFARSAMKAIVHGQIGRALHEVTHIRLRSTALEDVVALLRDQHDIPIWILDGDTTFPVTIDFRSLPLHMGLTTLCELSAHDWYASEDMLVIGKPETVARFGESQLQRDRRDAENRRINTPVTRELMKHTRLDFIEMPMQNVVANLAEMHGIPFYLTRDRAQVLFTGFMTRRSLSVALDHALFPLDLNWFTDGELIYVGDEARLRELRLLAALRTFRRENYSATFKDSLTAEVPRGLTKTAMPAVLEFLAKTSGLKIDFPKNDLADHQLHFTPTGIPLDTVLDLSLEPTGFRWEINGGTVLVRSRN